MRDVQVIWDLPDDPDGNYVHIVDGHDVTCDEVEEVLRDPNASESESRSSGQPCVFGWTSTGKYIIVVYEDVLDDPRTVYPITSYPVTPP
jgi:hypothetical protein